VALRAFTWGRRAQNASSEWNDPLAKFTLKGNSFHEHFQDGLKLCKAALMRKETVPLKLVYEPINRRDENAILVHARCDSWRPIGYIPGIKVPKVTVAIDANEITKIALTNFKY